MAKNIVHVVHQDISELLDHWIAAEQSGVEFPVPFDMAWPMAGYGRKSTAKRDGLRGLKEGKQFCTKKCNVPSRNASGATAKELINLSIDGFKHLCLMADTPEGEAVRQYFIDAEKNWKLVQQVAPSFAERKTGRNPLASDMGLSLRRL